MIKKKQYAFYVKVWHEDGEWNYSVIQDITWRGKTEVEPLGYGSVPTEEEAIASASAIVRDFFDES